MMANVVANVVCGVVALGRVVVVCGTACGVATQLGGTAVGAVVLLVSVLAECVE